ncbi:hypothetical protein [Fischerella sp. PCC 9605]|nr:hypothetical protein [Fischerella sp. PCC 9605]
MTIAVEGLGVVAVARSQQLRRQRRQLVQWCASGATSDRSCQRSAAPGLV